MKIWIIRHAKVNIKKVKKCNSLEFDEFAKLYDESEIINSDDGVNINCENLLVSELIRTHYTSKQLFGDKKYVVSELLNEVPMKSFIDTDKLLPLWVFNFLGRVQWFLNIKRQQETIKETRIRSNRLIDLLLEQNKDWILISHGIFMTILINEFKKRGFKIKNNSLIIKNLQVIEVEN